MQLSSLLPLAARSGQEHAGADKLLLETRRLLEGIERFQGVHSVS